MQEIGELTESKKMDIAYEHRCSQYTDELILYLKHKCATKSLSPSQAKVTLFSAPNSSHLLGQKTLELCLRLSDISCISYLGSLPEDEIFSIIMSGQSKVICFSIATEQALKQTEKLIKKIKSQFHKPPLIAIGGPYLINRDYKNSDVDYIGTSGILSEFIEFLKSSIQDLSACA